MDSEHLAYLLEANENLVKAVLQAQSRTQADDIKIHALANLAEYDFLTGLPNRIVFMNRLNHAIINARRRPDRLAVLFIDLNKFKHLNDTLGHAAGDQALKIAADCMVGAVREADTVCRYGGDEFVVLLGQISAVSDVNTIVEKIMASLSAPHRIGSHVVGLTASVGISLYPDDSDDAEKLIDFADKAMYAAKRSSDGRFKFATRDKVEESINHSASVGLPGETGLAEKERRRNGRRNGDEKTASESVAAKAHQVTVEQGLFRQTEFIAVLAHELRGPLGTIGNAATLMCPVQHDAVAAVKLQAIIQRQVTHLSRLLADVFDISRIATGKLRVELMCTDIVKDLKQAIESVRSSMDTRKQTLHCTLPDVPVEIDGDPVRLVQIFSNLLDNASKYSPENGSITLTMDVDEVSVTVKIIDTGIGIETDVLPKVFEMFSQAAHMKRLDGDGLGIGLAIVEELVEAQGGTVIAQSNGYGLGSQFTVRFPLRPKDVTLLTCG